MYSKLPNKNLVKVKVFGERNTGTNFLNRLLSFNTDLQVLRHGRAVSRTHLKTLEDSARQLGSAGPFSSQLRQLVLNRFVDEQRSNEYKSNFGWKHARVLVNDLQRSPHKEDTLFIFLIRNPWRFVSALHAGRTTCFRLRLQVQALLPSLSPLFWRMKEIECLAIVTIPLTFGMRK